MLSVSIGFSIFFLALRFFHRWKRGEIEEIGKALMEPRNINMNSLCLKISRN